MLGFLAAIESYMVYRTQKRLHIGQLEHEEENSHWKNTKLHMQHTYGATPNAHPAVLSINRGSYANMYHSRPEAEMTAPGEAGHGHGTEAGQGHGETAAADHGHAEHA